MQTGPTEAHAADARMHARQRRERAHPALRGEPLGHTRRHDVRARPVGCDPEGIVLSVTPRNSPNCCLFTPE